MILKYHFETCPDRWVIRIAIPLADLRLKHEGQLQPLAESIEREIEKFIEEKKPKLTIVKDEQ